MKDKSIRKITVSYSLNPNGLRMGISVVFVHKKICLFKKSNTLSFFFFVLFFSFFFFSYFVLKKTDCVTTKIHQVARAQGCAHTVEISLQPWLR